MLIHTRSQCPEPQTALGTQLQRYWERCLRHILQAQPRPKTLFLGLYLYRRPCKDCWHWQANPNNFPAWEKELETLIACLQKPVRRGGLPYRAVWLPGGRAPAEDTPPQPEDPLTGQPARPCGHPLRCEHIKSKTCLFSPGVSLLSFHPR